MSDRNLTGYAVVLAVPEDFVNPINPRYSGIDLVPAYPSGIAEESYGMDRYVFGGLTDSRSNLIESLDTAIRLRDMLAKRRDFNILYCCSDETAAKREEEQIGRFFVHLGYDVAAVIGSYLSPLHHMPNETWARRYADCLNEFGLFSSCAIATNYCNEYCHMCKDPDRDAYDTVFLSKVCFDTL